MAYIINQIPTTTCGSEKIMGCLVCDSENENDCKSCMYGAVLQTYTKKDLTEGKRCVKCKLEGCKVCVYNEDQTEMTCKECKDGMQLKTQQNGDKYCSILMKMGIAVLWVLIILM